MPIMMESLLRPGSKKEPAVIHMPGLPATRSPVQHPTTLVLFGSRFEPSWPGLTTEGSRAISDTGRVRMMR